MSLLIADCEPPHCVQCHHPRRMATEGETAAMLVKEIMSKAVVFCLPWDTAETAARLMKEHAIGALLVVWHQSDPLLEGIITDRNLCSGVVDAHGNAIPVFELMTVVPVTCEAESTIEECFELMEENQVSRMPVVDKRGRCGGMVTQADIARQLPAANAKEPLDPLPMERDRLFQKHYFYCGQTHEQDQILLLKRRRELRRNASVLS